MILSTQNGNFIFDSHTSYLIIEIDSVNEWKYLKSYIYENPFLVEKMSEGGWKMGQKSAKKGCFWRKKIMSEILGRNHEKGPFRSKKIVSQIFWGETTKKVHFKSKNDHKWNCRAKPQKRVF